MNLKDQCCGNCNAFVINEEQTVRPGDPLPGFCRASRPYAAPSIMQVNSPIEMQRRMAQAIQSFHPPAAANGWCREWEPEGFDHWSQRKGV